MMAHYDSVSHSGPPTPGYTTHLQTPPYGSHISQQASTVVGAGVPAASRRYVQGANVPVVVTRPKFSY
jgi:hypothetical protein